MLIGKLMVNATSHACKELNATSLSSRRKSGLPIWSALLALLLHSPVMAQSPLASEELRLIADAFGKIQSEYVTPIEESAVATACREGILRTVNDSAAGKHVYEDLPDFGSPSLRQATHLIPYFLEKLPDVASARQLADGCLSGMFTALDPHSIYLDPKALKELRGNPGTPYGAVGLELGMQDGYAKIVSVLDGTPGQRAGLLAGDLITRIDGVRVKGLSLDGVVENLRGPLGSTTNIVIARKNVDAPMIFNLRREFIRPRSVSAKFVNEKYCYIQVRRLNANTVEELGAALRSQEFSNLTEMVGIVLDLRNNQGGVLPGMIGVAAAFLPPHSRIAGVKGRTPESTMQFYGRSDFYGSRNTQDPLRELPDGFKVLPMLVLVNRKTASGAELIAASLQDYRRAKVIGAQTLGYGTVQTIRLLDPQTAIKITTAKLIRPNGDELDRKGVTPDHVITMKAELGSEFGSSADTELAEALYFFKE